MSLQIIAKEVEMEKKRVGIRLSEHLINQVSGGGGDYQKVVDPAPTPYPEPGTPGGGPLPPSDPKYFKLIEIKVPF